MDIFELNLYLNNLLNISNFSAYDISQNGLQVENSGKRIRKIAFAVDCCIQTISAAIERQADVLIVHHGLFWSKSLLVCGTHFKRLKLLINSDTALFGIHVPLDVHPIYGNNAGLANRLHLENVKTFGNYNGLDIGMYGEFQFAGNTKNGFLLNEIIPKLFPDGEKPIHILPFGKPEIKTVGIISGKASSFINEAINLNLDLYITGEIEHTAYHTALENKINVIAGGHYQTETVGLKLLARKTELDTDIETCFIEAPTGL